MKSSILQLDHVELDDLDTCGTNRINASRSNILLNVFKLEMGQ